MQSDSLAILVKATLESLWNLRAHVNVSSGLCHHFVFHAMARARHGRTTTDARLSVGQTYSQTFMPHRTTSRGSRAPSRIPVNNLITLSTNPASRLKLLWPHARVISGCPFPDSLSMKERSCSPQSSLSVVSGGQPGGYARNLQSKYLLHGGQVRIQIGAALHSVKTSGR